ncbi:MAG: isocitrate/isopropylmalate family dehydrogenase [Flavobacteriia bacterium]|nr:isocitrate/isopropylmalate family dehydrogenase [Flavobacteriia bacterium]
MNLKIALLPHSDYGDLVMNQAVKCIRAIEENYNHHFTTTTLDSLERESGFWLTEEVIKSCRNSDAILSSFPITQNKFYQNSVQKSLNLIQLLDCQASVAPILSFPEVLYKSEKNKVNATADFVIFSALKAGQYNLNPDNQNPNSDIYTPNIQGIHQLFHLAFKTAKNRNKKLLVVTPNGPRKIALWDKTLAEISLSYPMVQVSKTSMEEVMTLVFNNPKHLDCVFADEIMGPILQSQSKAISEMNVVLPLAHTGMGINLFEPLYNIDTALLTSDPNPISAIYCVALMLSRFGLQEEAYAIQLAINSAASRGMFGFEQQLAKQLSCDQLGDFISAAIIDADDIGELNDENIDLGKSTII